MAGTPASRAKRKYNEKNYVRVFLQVKPELKEEWQAAADSAGESLSRYITTAVAKRIKNDGQK